MSMLPANDTSRQRWSVGLQLFMLSFAALFLELMLIRWVPAVVRLVAYYANLMLISSFLGLGIGAMLARRPMKRFGWFPLLLVVHIGLLLWCEYMNAAPPVDPREARFEYVPNAPAVNYLILIAIFFINSLLFVPFGQRIGELFHELPPLRAYSWDLGGSLCGTLCFGLFSLLSFSAIIGLSAVMLIYLVLASSRGRIAGVILFPLALTGAWYSTDRTAVWSPYHYVTMAQFKLGMPMTDPPADLRTMQDPPVYWARIGQHFYQQHLTLRLERYSPDNEMISWIEHLRGQYLLPYEIANHRDKVLVMGAGGGADVEAALLAGAKQVDAVEIDPALVRLSLKHSAAAVYEDPRVNVRIDDGRAALRAMPDGYDLIVFGFLDSQALFSYMSNLRLDGYIYTVESMRTAWNKLGPDGVLSISFGCLKEWLPPKLILTLQEATGVMPIVYTDNKGTLIVIAPRGEHREPPEHFARFARMPLDAGMIAPIELPTDDWPYLYLQNKMVPRDYQIVIAALAVLSVVMVTIIRGRQFGFGDAHFFFLGMGFLLLQTKSITDCSLYFGATWLVTTIVIAGVLLMVLGANLVAMRLRGPSPWFYMPLIASLLLLYFTPRDWVLGHSLAFRLAWSLLIVPLPIFFAGLIFSTTFRLAPNPSAAFGANLIGATIGGFCEYLGMAIGTNHLSLIVMTAYVLSFVCWRWWKSPRSMPATT